MQLGKRLGIAALAAAMLAGCAESGSDSATAPELAVGRADKVVITATGDLAAALTEYRNLLGANNGGVDGPLEGGRRQITWDGVPELQTNTNDFPGDFFNVATPRGVIYTTPGSGFRISNNDASDLDPSYGVQFQALSPERTFFAVGSEITEVTFRVVGSDVPAASRGLGVVFSDVDRMGSASLKLFDAQGRSLGQYHAPIRSDAAGHSFVGVAFDDPIVARVVITSGQGALTGLDLSDGGNRDLVIMDDFILGEPQPLD